MILVNLFCRGSLGGGRTLKAVGLLIFNIVMWVENANATFQIVWRYDVNTGISNKCNKSLTGVDCVRQSGSSSLDVATGQFKIFGDIMRLYIPNKAELPDHSFNLEEHCRERANKYNFKNEVPTERWNELSGMYRTWPSKSNRECDRLRVPGSGLDCVYIEECYMPVYFDPQRDEQLVSGMNILDHQCYDGPLTYFLPNGKIVTTNSSVCMGTDTNYRICIDSLGDDGKGYSRVTTRNCNFFLNHPRDAVPVHSRHLVKVHNSGRLTIKSNIVEVMYPGCTGKFSSLTDLLNGIDRCEISVETQGLVTATASRLRSTISNETVVNWILWVLGAPNKQTLEDDRSFFVALFGNMTKTEKIEAATELNLILQHISQLRVVVAIAAVATVICMSNTVMVIMLLLMVCCGCCNRNVTKDQSKTVVNQF